MGRTLDGGGFVFPMSWADQEHIEHGVTFRDWLAGMAMQGMLAAAQKDRDAMHPTTALEIARGAYHIADVMLKMAKEPPLLRHELPDEDEIEAQVTAAIQ